MSGVINLADSSSYRERIYKNYTQNIQNKPNEFEPGAAGRLARARDYYLRGWLPESKQAKIVDLGCGAGELLYFFRQRAYENLCGVDVSPQQVEVATPVVPSVEMGNAIDFVEGAVGEYDLITAFDVIEHFQKHEVLRFLDGCQEALKPGGRLVLQTPNAETPWGTHHRYNDFTHEVCFNPNALTNLLQLCGLSEVEVRETGPVPAGYSAKSSVRWMLWQGIRAVLKFYNVVETGNSGSGVFTRVFLASGIRELPKETVSKQ